MTADTELASHPDRGTNPRRVAAGRTNRAKRGPLSPAGRERLRAAAAAGRPWEAGTGPVTAAGKARAAANGCGRQVGPVSVRAARREVAAVAGVLAAGRAVRGLAGGSPSAG